MASSKIEEPEMAPSKMTPSSSSSSSSIHRPYQPPRGSYAASISNIQLGARLGSVLSSNIGFVVVTGSS
jgi:hypothetical protein